MSFKSIALIARQQRTGATETLQELVDFLVKKNCKVWIEESSKNLLGNRSIPVISFNQLDQKIDLIIVIGGDGSLLHAAKTAVKHAIPIIGINRGTLGFLTDITPEEACVKIAEILNGDFKEEQRGLLQTDIHHHGATVATGLALNDIVLLPGKDSAQMIEFDISVNKEFVCHQRSDGLIVATPTGSTAYALSAGGPIMSPDVDALTLVPMFPHTLSMRPLVVPTNSKIKITIANELETKPRISCDGETPIDVPAGGHIHIEKSQYALRLLHPKNYEYFDTLRQKLHWGEKLC